MQEFFTREANSTPQKLPLKKITGEPTEHYLMIVGTESDRFRLAQAEAMRYMVVNGAKMEEEQRLLSGDDLTEEEYEELDRNSVQGYSTRLAVQSLIKDWSLPQDCNKENRMELLYQAPYILDSLNSFAGNQGNFIKK